MNIAGITKALFGHSFFLNPLFTVALLSFAFIIATRNKTHNILKFFAGFFIIYLISGFIGLKETPQDLWRYPIKLASSTLIIPYSIYSLRKVLDKRKVQMLLVFLMLASSAFTIIQYFFYDFFRPICMAIENRPSGLWINPNLAGLVFYLTYVMTLDIEMNKKWIVKLARYLCLIAILLTFSRTIYLITISTLTGYVLLKNSKRYWTNSILLFLAVTISFSSLYPTFNENQKGRLLSFFQFAKGEKIKSNTRKYVWTYSYNYVKSNGPLTGTGHSSMNHVAPFEGGKLGPHNFYIWIWGNSGIIGLIAFLTLIIGILFKTGKYWFKSKDLRPAMFAFAFFFFAIFEHAFPFDHTIGLLIGLALIIFEDFKFTKKLV